MTFRGNWGLALTAALAPRKVNQTREYLATSSGQERGRLRTYRVNTWRKTHACMTQNAAMAT